MTTPTLAHRPRARPFPSQFCALCFLSHVQQTPRW